jgi:ribosome biogenesis GTPase
VVALQANFCRVELDVPGPGGVGQLLCVRRSRLGKQGETIRAGDRVLLEGIDWADGRGAVASALPRTNLLERPAVANCDRLVVVVSLAQPAPDPLQLTRFLLTAEATGLPLELVFTKVDLPPAAEVLGWCERVRRWGYEPIAVSSRQGSGLAALRERLVRPGLTVFCGPSGVGKSSLLNALVPDLALRVGAVSGRLQRGRHTTRHVELVRLAPGALLADTPGFNRPELPDDPARLGPLFPEIRAALAEGPCRFGNCRHRGDPGCRVGSDWDRHPFYLQCLEGLEQRAAMPAERPAEGTKLRGHRLEPRIDRRRREPSRRRRRQEEDPAAAQAREPLSPPDPAG